MKEKSDQFFKGTKGTTFPLDPSFYLIETDFKY